MVKAKGKICGGMWQVQPPQVPQDFMPSPTSDVGIPIWGKWTGGCFQIYQKYKIIIIIIIQIEAIQYVTNLLFFNFTKMSKLRKISILIKMKHRLCLIYEG